MGYEYFGDKKKFRPRPLNVWERLVIIQKKCAWSVFHFSGLRFLYEKIRPHNKEKTQSPPSLFLWIIVGYLMIFGLSSYRFQSRFQELSGELQSLETQLTAAASLDGSRFKELIATLPGIQNALCPVEPSFFNPVATVGSLFAREKNSDILGRSMRIFANWRYQLNEITLVNPIFMDIGLNGANFSGSRLERARFINSDLENANFREAELLLSMFHDAQLTGADFGKTLIAFTSFRNNQDQTVGSKTKAGYPDFPETLLFYVDLRGVVLNYKQLSGASTLYGSALTVTLCDQVIKNKRSLLDAPHKNLSLTKMKEIETFAKSYQFIVDNQLAGFLSRLSGKSCSY